VQRIKPDYSGANITNVVPALLGTRPVEWLPPAVEGARSVVLLVLDGLGWEARSAHASRLPELTGLDGGPITSVVPSTTPAALTSLTTGLPPSRHGITGFRIRVDHTVLNAIRWQQENGKRPPAPEGMQRHDVFSGRPVPVVTKAEFRTSGFTGVHLRGADFYGWETTSVLVEHVRARVADGARFVYAYYPGVDEVAHAHGLVAPFYERELEAADRLVGAVRDALPDDVAVVVTADHGQVHLDDGSWLGLGALDRMVATYAGDARFRYLHARDGAAGELVTAATELVADDGWVFSREQLLDEGWMGDGASKPARQRIGDVVLAARGSAAFVDPTFVRETGLRSAHGSLTPRELEVPLLAARGRG
jgi:Type I phosphodiesterase / nucleotide pyrophosphatase